jgi:hypothetical protein
MNFNIISPVEKELLRQIELRNDSDIFLWRISNIIIPIITILISIGCYFLFKPSDSISIMAFLNLLINGSIPMIALNRIGGLGIYLFKYDRGKEKQYGISDTYILRTKLFFWFLFIVIGTIILYVYQVLHHPFELSCGVIILIVISVASVFSSIDVSKKVYLLQDKLIDRTFEQEVREDMQNKGHGRNWN